MLVALQASALAARGGIRRFGDFGRRRSKKFSQLPSRVRLAEYGKLTVELSPKCGEWIPSRGLFSKLCMTLHRDDDHFGAVVIRDNDFAMGIGFIDDVAPMTLDV